MYNNTRYMKHVSDPKYLLPGLRFYDGTVTARDSVTLGVGAGNSLGAAVG